VPGTVTLRLAGDVRLHRWRGPRRSALSRPSPCRCRALSPVTTPSAPSSAAGSASDPTAIDAPGAATDGQDVSGPRRAVCRTAARAPSRRRRCGEEATECTGGYGKGRSEYRSILKRRTLPVTHRSTPAGIGADQAGAGRAGRRRHSPLPQCARGRHLWSPRQGTAPRTGSWQEWRAWWLASAYPLQNASVYLTVTGALAAI
jgi:hypothetical protein